MPSLCAFQSLHAPSDWKNDQCNGKNPNSNPQASCARVGGILKLWPWDLEEQGNSNPSVPVRLSQERHFNLTEENEGNEDGGTGLKRPVGADLAGEYLLAKLAR
jgi:hypothetical protein